MAAATMRAGIATVDGIGIHEVAKPAPGDHEILVKVATIGVDRADLGESKAKNDAPLTIPGLEWAGQVTEVGRAVTGVRIGDTVMCKGNGGYAEYAVTDAGHAIVFDPKEIDIKQAAALPLALLTCHDALVTQGRMTK